jgi:two-component system nitrogen regulation response regulator GlnG/two-component system response regulator HydG
VRHAYTHHVRELTRLLWTAIASSDAHYVALGDAVRAQLAPATGGGAGTAPGGAGAPRAAPAAVPLRDEVQTRECARIVRALEDSGWNQSVAAEKLGIARGTLIKRMTVFRIKRPRVP